jgi:hypothetical protein
MEKLGSATLGIRFGIVSLRGYGCLMRKVKAGGKRP